MITGKVNEVFTSTTTVTTLPNIASSKIQSCAVGFATDPEYWHVWLIDFQDVFTPEKLRPHGCGAPTAGGATPPTGGTLPTAATTHATSTEVNAKDLTLEPAYSAVMFATVRR